jgi:hypothetical protein
LLREVVREAATCVGVEEPSISAEPTFERIAEQVLYERSFEAGVAIGDGSPADARNA